LHDCWKVYLSTLTDEDIHKVVTYATKWATSRAIVADFRDILNRGVHQFIAQRDALAYTDTPTFFGPLRLARAK